MRKIRHVNFSKIIKSTNRSKELSDMAKSKGVGYWELMEELYPKPDSTDVK